MDKLEKIKYYRQSFKMLEKNNHNFLEYLTKNNLDYVNILLELGLNPNIVQSYNYAELNELAKKVLESAKFPQISYPYLNDENKADDLSICNSEKDMVIVIKENSVDFNLVYKEEDNLKEQANFTTYVLGNNVLKKKNIELDKEMGSSDYFVDALKIKASEQYFDNQGNVIAEGNYEIRINTPLTMMKYTNICRPLMFDSIVGVYHNIEMLINAGKLNTEDVEIIGSGELVKK